MTEEVSVTEPLVVVLVSTEPMNNFPLRGGALVRVQLLPPIEEAL